MAELLDNEAMGESNRPGIDDLDERVEETTLTRGSPLDKAIKTTGSIDMLNALLDTLACQDGTQRSIIIGIFTRLTNGGKGRADVMSELYNLRVEGFMKKYREDDSPYSQPEPVFNPRETTSSRLREAARELEKDLEESLPESPRDAQRRESELTARFYPRSNPDSRPNPQSLRKDSSSTIRAVTAEEIAAATATTTATPQTTEQPTTGRHRPAGEILARQRTMGMPRPNLGETTAKGEEAEEESSRSFFQRATAILKGPLKPKA